MDDIFASVLPFWHHLTEDEKDLILQHTLVQSFDKGSFLHYGKNDCVGLEIVNYGQLRVFITSPNGGEITLYRLLDHNVCILSAACMMKGMDLDIHMEVEKDSQVYIIPTGIYDLLSEKHSEMKDFTLELVSSKFSDIMWLMNQLVFSNMGQRLANALLEHRKLSGSSTINITHELLARDLGTAREVVTRLLKQFQTDGIVSLSRGSIEILDKEHLRNM